LAENLLNVDRTVTVSNFLLPQPESFRQEDPVHSQNDNKRYNHSDNKWKLPRQEVLFADCLGLVWGAISVSENSQNPSFNEMSRKF
jgi:hypothetical protein